MSDKEEVEEKKMEKDYVYCIVDKGRRRRWSRTSRATVTGYLG